MNNDPPKMTEQQLMQRLLVEQAHLRRRLEAVEAAQVAYSSLRLALAPKRVDALSSLAERVTVLEQQVEQLQKLTMLEAHLHDLEETPPKD